MFKPILDPGATLIAEIVLNYSYEPEERTALGLSVLRQAEPLPFAVEIYYEISRSVGILENNKPRDPVYSVLILPAAYPEMRKVIAERIEKQSLPFYRNTRQAML